MDFKVGSHVPHIEAAVTDIHFMGEKMNNVVQFGVGIDTEFEI